MLLSVELLHVVMGCVGKERPRQWWRWRGSWWEERVVNSSSLRSRTWLLWWSRRWRWQGKMSLKGTGTVVLLLARNSMSFIAFKFLMLLLCMISNWCTEFFWFYWCKVYFSKLVLSFSAAHCCILNLTKWDVKPYSTIPSRARDAWLSTWSVLRWSVTTGPLLPWAYIVLKRISALHCEFSRSQLLNSTFIVSATSRA